MIMFNLLITTVMVTFLGNPVSLSSSPKEGEQAREFTLVKNDLSEVSLSDYKGKKVVLNIFPSIDTPVCANSVRRFNQEAASFEDVVVLCVSKDLPFAQARFCGAEGIESVSVLSGYRDLEFGLNYGVSLLDGPLKGLYCRAVYVIDENGSIVYKEIVPEITDEPNYAAALGAIK